MPANHGPTHLNVCKLYRKTSYGAVRKPVANVFQSSQPLQRYLGVPHEPVLVPAQGLIVDQVTA